MHKTPTVPAGQSSYSEWPVSRESEHRVDVIEAGNAERTLPRTVR